MNENKIETPIPEKLNLWDRLFNRYRRVVHQRGQSFWQHYLNGCEIGKEYARPWVEYKVIDRLTGSIKIERDYLD